MPWYCLLPSLVLTASVSLAFAASVEKAEKKTNVSEVASRMAIGTFGSTEVDIDEGFLSGGVSVGLVNAQEIGAILGSGLRPLNLGSVVIGGNGNCGGAGSCFGGSWESLFNSAPQQSSVSITEIVKTTSFGLIEVNNIDSSGNTIVKPIQIENPVIPIRVPRDGTLVTKLLEKLTITTILQTNLGNIFRVLLATQIIIANPELYNPILTLYNAIILRQINMDLILPSIVKFYNSPPATQLIIVIQEIVKIAPPELIKQVKSIFLIIQRTEIQLILEGSLKMPSICEGFTLDQVTYLLDMKIPVFGSGFRDISITNIQYIVERVLRPVLIHVSMNSKRIIVKNIVYLILVNLPLGYGISEAPFRVRDFALKLIVLLSDKVWDILMPRIRLIPLDNIYEAVRLFLLLLLDTPGVPALIIAYVKVIITYIPGSTPIIIPEVQQPTPPPIPKIIWPLWPPTPPTPKEEVIIEKQVQIYIPEEIVVEFPSPIDIPSEQTVKVGTFGYPSLTIISGILPPTPSELDNPSILLPFCPLTFYGCDKLEAIRLLLRRPEIIVRIRREINYLDYPNKALLLQEILKVIVRLNLGPGEIIIKIKEYLSQVETEPYDQTFQPWFLKLLQNILNPRNEREQLLYEILVKWLSQQQIYNIIGTGFNARPYETIGALVKYILEFSVQNILQVQQNQPLVEAIRYFVLKIQSSSLASQSLEEILARYTIIRRAVDLNSILLTLDRGKIGLELQGRILEFFNYEFKPSVHMAGMNLSRYNTKGQFLKGLVDHLLKQKISSSAKFTLQTIRPFIRLQGAGGQQIEFIK